MCEDTQKLFSIVLMCIRKCFSHRPLINESIHLYIRWWCLLIYEVSRTPHQEHEKLFYTKVFSCTKIEVFSFFFLDQSIRKGHKEFKTKLGSVLDTKSNRFRPFFTDIYFCANEFWTWLGSIPEPRSRSFDQFLGIFYSSIDAERSKIDVELDEEDPRYPEVDILNDFW